MSIWVAPAYASASVPDPPRNLVMGELPASCNSAVGGTAAACENAVVYYLNQARATLGLSAYRLPADFPQLSPDRQIFILSDLDRAAYSLPPVIGLNTELSADAAKGVAAGDDPSLSAWNYGWNAYYSNWAGAFVNAPQAYYFWVYDDGPGSGNLACNSPSDSGCWGHRHNILFDSLGSGEYEAAMGAAAGERTTGEAGYAQLTVSASPHFSPRPPYYYTWVEAQADGAGTYPYDPGVPDLSRADGNQANLHLTLTFRHKVLRIGGSGVLLGHLVAIAVRRERVPCALKLSATQCAWVKFKPVRRHHLRLSKRTSIRLRPPGRWERVAIHVRTESLKGYGAAVAGLLLRGPKPHHVAR
ncbi:MAG TPA: hypothetical protein VGN84_09615 [Solirubrobacterales bacterium]|nr:hypothetical protein [Solirubrobacterales bacterium]